MHHKVRKEQERKERKPIEGVETKSATWAICEGNRMECHNGRRKREWLRNGDLKRETESQ